MCVSDTLAERCRRFCMLFLALALVASLAIPQVSAPPSGQKPEQGARVPGAADAISEVQIYSRARSLIDMTREELQLTYPSETQDLEFDENSDVLNTLLEKVGARVESFFRDFPNTLSKEQVRREIMGSHGNVEDSETQYFSYSVYSDPSGTLEEVRTDSRGHPLPVTLMSKASYLTTGFASMSVYFRPRYQAGSRFRYLGRQRSASRAYVIAFAQRPGNANVVGIYSSAFTPGQAQLLYQGLAWVDPDTYQIVRMRTDLLAPRLDVLLGQVTSELTFGEVRFVSIPEAFWLPREVVVTIQADGRMFRNLHRYSDYQLFTVGAQDKILPPVVKK